MYKINLNELNVKEFDNLFYVVSLIRCNEVNTELFTEKDSL